MVNLTKITDCVLVFLMVAFSGIPFFYYSRIEVLVAMWLLPLAVFVHRKRTVDWFVVGYLIVVMGILFLQTIKFYHFSALSYAGLLIRITFTWLVIRAVGIKLIPLFVKTMVVLVCISLFFYLAGYVPGVHRLLIGHLAPLFDHPFMDHSGYKVWPQIAVFTFNTSGEALGNVLIRNAGPFWEPGAFAGFLIVAVMLQTLTRARLWADWSNRILILGLVTTFSTTGLLAGAVWIGGYYLIKGTGFQRLVVLPVAAIALLLVYQSVAFLGDKVSRAMSFNETTYNTRFKSAARDWNDWLQNPLLGMGMTKATRFGGEKNQRDIHRNNGLTDLLATYGLPVFAAYFFLIGLSFYRIGLPNPNQMALAVLALLVVMLIGFSEIYFNKIFFYGLTFLHVLYPSTSPK